MSEYIKVIKAGPSITVLRKGGQGSGNFGHEGRPGLVGGSGEGGGGDGMKESIVVSGFHGCRASGSAMDIAGSELWISPSAEMARDRAGKNGEVYPVTIEIKKPLDMRPLGEKASINEINLFLAKNGLDYQIREMEHQKGKVDVWGILSRDVEPEQSAMLFKNARLQDYDGIVLYDNTAKASDNPNGLTYIQLRRGDAGLQM